MNICSRSRIVNFHFLTVYTRAVGGQPFFSMQASMPVSLAHTWSRIFFLFLLPTDHSAHIRFRLFPGSTPALLMRIKSAGVLPGIQGFSIWLLTSRFQMPNSSNLSSLRNLSLAKLYTKSQRCKIVSVLMSRYEYRMISPVKTNIWFLQEANFASSKSLLSQHHSITPY